MAGDLTANFSLSEFAQRDPYRPVPAKYRANALRLARQLQPLRDVVGRIVITSSYRTEAHNTEIGGADKSQHLTAKAADFTVPGVSNKKVYCAILALIPKDMEQGGLGWYGEKTATRTPHIHYDVRGSKSRWNKTNGPLPVCPPVAEEEDEAMKAYTIDGRGTQVWGYTGKDFWRMTSAEFSEAKALGLKTPLPKLSKARFDAIRKRLHLD